MVFQIDFQDDFQVSSSHLYFEVHLGATLETN